MVKHSKKIGGPSDLEEEGNVSLWNFGNYSFIDTVHTSEVMSLQ
jgi:hypothetical protein